MIQTKPSRFKSFQQTFVIVLTSFLLWLLFSFSMSHFDVKNSRDISIKTGNPESLDMSKFWEVYSMIREEYLQGEQVSQNDIVTWAIAGMVEALGDKHSSYFNPEQTQKFNNTLSGDFEWIGASVEKNDFGVVIDRLLKGSPAKTAGVRQWDVVIEANGHDLAELNLYNAVDKIKWPAWTSVVLKILRSWEKEVLEIEVIREKIKIPSVESELFENNIGYISVNMFGDDTSRDFQQALNELKDSSGLIIDLRDNGGGYLNSAVDILSSFIPYGEALVSTSYKKLFSNRVYQSHNDGTMYTGKIVVLMNENSASASEITAWALRDYNLALVVGTQSYGKWSVQEPFIMSDGSMLKLTIAEWLTPNKNKIDGVGIKPDITVEFEESDFPTLEAGGEFYDRQLEEAKKILDIFIEKQFIGITIDEYKRNKE